MMIVGSPLRPSGRTPGSSIVSRNTVPAVSASRVRGTVTRAVTPLPRGGTVIGSGPSSFPPCRTINGYFNVLMIVTLFPPASSIATGG